MFQQHTPTPAQLLFKWQLEHVQQDITVHGMFHAVETDDFEQHVDIKFFQQMRS
jgi:hypothetical protein